MLMVLCFDDVWMVEEEGGGGGGGMEREKTKTQQGNVGKKQGHEDGHQFVKT